MQNKKPKLTIFLGDVNESLAKIATVFDSSAQLLDHSNYKQFFVTTQNKDTVIYTSLGDLPKDLEVVYRILIQATRVIYCPPRRWSDARQIDVTDPGKSIQGLTEVMLSILPKSIQIDNYNPNVPDPITLCDQRKSMNPQLWSVGCSIAHGLGVLPGQRYGQLLSDELGMSCSFLTRPGSAIDWAADQILRSDIQEKDIVVWGVTAPNRLTYVYNDTLLKGITPRHYKDFPEYEKIISLENLYSQNTFYKHFYAIQQVTNYCSKIKAHLILVGLLAGGHAIQRIINTQKNYVNIDYHYDFKNSFIETKFIDVGTDNEHPGPKQHIQYKENILDKLKQLEII